MIVLGARTGLYTDTILESTEPRHDWLWGKDRGHAGQIVNFYRGDSGVGH